MVRNARRLARFERRRIAADKPDYERNLSLLESMYAEARALGKQPSPGLSDHVKNLIRVVRLLRRVQKTA